MSLITSAYITLSAVIITATKLSYCLGGGRRSPSAPVYFIQAKVSKHIESDHFGVFLS